SSWIALFLSGVCPLLFCLMGWHPSRMFKRCFATERGTSVMYAGFQANIFKFYFSKLQSSILPFSDRLSPIMTVWSGYFGWIATSILSVTAGFLGGLGSYASITILHSAGIVVLLRIVTIPPSTGNFSIL
ncbi:hypothetical protein Tco_0398828, partial [Tanacetum coccineum]